ITLSVIVPAFNETSRLPIMLQETVDYLDARSDRDKTFRYEVIVVDDGSTDDTSGTALKFAKEYAERLGAKKYREREIRVMTLEKNRGKGGAVTQGMMVARGELLLFADADGATKFSEVEKLEASAKAIEERGLSIAVGSRAHMLKTDAVVKRSFIRNLLMRAFHLIVFVLGIASIDDTQCGFKLVTRRAGQIIFPNMHAEGWIFDIELLLIAINLEIPIAEVPVKWHEVEGTKMSLIKDSIIMLKDLLVIRLNYTLGLW
ncbi:nucleotide-diphospho-sugar transferase, partial [Phlyctochytrium arcticum]